MNILFVEDDPMNRRVVSDMLKVAGLELAEAENAEIGLVMVEQNTYDLILMDLRMPGMDGLEAIRRIRARADVKAAVPVIVVTADTASDLAEQCSIAGADDLLLKPVAMNALFETIGKVMAAKSATTALV